MAFPHTPTAIIFDMDGVLVDSEVHWKKVESEFLGGLLPSWGEEDQKRIIGMSSHDVHAFLTAEYGLNISKAEYFAYYKGLSQVIYGERSSMLPGAAKLVREADTAGFPVALASSSPHSWISIVLDRFDLRRHFRVVVSSDDLSGKGKPAPDIYLKTAALLRVNPRECLAIEDTEKGIRSAKGAGMRVAGVLNGFNEPADVAGADAVVNGFAAMALKRFLACAWPAATESE